jgi:hypothetical protein
MTNTFLNVVISGVMAGLVLSGCSDTNLGNQSDFETSQSATPVPSKTPEYLFGSKLPHGISPVTPEAIDVDRKALLQSLTFFVVEEGDGSPLDYSYNWEDFQSRSVLSRAAIESNRERDKVELGIFAPTVMVWMDGTTSIILQLKFDSPQDLKATCNGAVIEVDGFAYKVQSQKSCEDPPGKSDYLPWIIDSENTHEMRLLGHLGSMPFTIRLLDTDGLEHLFDFNSPSIIDSQPECAESIDLCKYRLSAQDLIRVAVQASKAVEAGLGY